jgi:SAM-dependent methyltransferase
MISREFIERVYPELPFGGFSRVDGTIPLLSRAHALAEGAKVVLEIGCGRGKARDDSSNYRRKLHDFRAPGRTVIGIDVDPVAATNPLIDEYRRIGSDFKWPVEDASIDFAFSDYVLEHVGNPEAYFAELRRVLKPGGYFLARTPSKFSYIAVAARLIPNSLHARVLGKAQLDRKEEDVFPTVYRANSKRQLNRLIRGASLVGTVYSVECEPWYMTFSRIAFRVMSVVHRVLPGFLHSTLIVLARKPA